MFLVEAVLVKDIVATTVAYNDAKKSVERWDLTHITDLIHIKKLYQGHVQGSKAATKVGSDISYSFSCSECAVLPKTFYVKI